MNYLIRDLKLELGLSKPVEFILLETESNNLAEYESVYSDRGILKKHIITFYLKSFTDNDRDFNTILAHEMIHAWQEECEISDLIHGPDFQEWAEYLGQIFDFPNIYDPDVDRD